MIYPDDKLAVIVLTNSSNGSAWRLAEQVAGKFVPSLIPKPPQPIEDKEPEVTALLRECLAALATWNLKEEKFTAEMWKFVGKQRAFAQPLAIALGQLKSVDLLGREQSGDARTYRYRATFTNAVLLVTLVLDKDGKIAGASVDYE